MQRLKVCLAEVKRSRPFFVALLGDRYGWIPPAERIQAATREACFQGQVAGLSVTELEIDYGTLMAMVTSPDRKGQIWGHCLTAPPGAGKSAVFAEICRRLRDRDLLFLAHAAGVSPQDCQVESILRRWVGELSTTLCLEDPLTTKANIEKLAGILPVGGIGRKSRCQSRLGCGTAGRALTG